MWASDPIAREKGCLLACRMALARSPAVLGVIVHQHNEQYQLKDARDQHRNPSRDILHGTYKKVNKPAQAAGSLDGQSQNAERS